MTLISLEFVLFLGILLFSYFLLPAKWQWGILLCANIVFYMSAGFPYIFYIAVTSMSAFGCAIWVEKISGKYKKIRTEECSTKEERQANKAKCSQIQKRIMAGCLLLNFGIWIFIKYTGFLFGIFKVELSIPEIIVPIGISFYTFIAMGYCIDVYRGKYPAEKNFGKFALFISFFPHVIQGPFSRYNYLKETLFEVHKFSGERFRHGLLRIVWGVFKKTVIAYQIGIVADTIYQQQVPYEGVYIIVLMVLVTLRLYADFSGYMDIICGICRIMGIRLEENFKQPLFARSIEEVWRRWHITLGAWFRDYVFYTISMSKKVQKLGRRCRDRLGNTFGRMIPSYIALFFVWTATGLWHGAAWYYLIWGWMNLFVIVTSMQLAPVYAKVKEKLHIPENNKGWRVFQMIRTFMIFGYMEMFSSSSSASESIRLTLSMFRLNNLSLLKNPSVLFPGIEAHIIFMVAIGVFLMLAVDVMKEKQINIFERLERVPVVMRYIGYVGIGYMIILFSSIGSDAGGEFMYAQF